jgi:hypothetical protein
VSTYSLGALKAIKLKTGIHQSFHGSQTSWSSANHTVLTHREISISTQLVVNSVPEKLIALHPHLK